MSTQRPGIHDSVLELVGRTPLVRLHKVVDGCRTPVYGKCEFMNPGGSVKDRIGLAMIEDAEMRGVLRPGGTIVEATSGNTGLALAMAAAPKGYRCIFTMPDKMSQEKVKLLRAFGAEVVITPTAVPPDHPEPYLMKAKSIAAETPGAVLADQFYNAANPDAHYRSTGPELWEQSEGRITHFFAGAGTGGTITGAGRYLKERDPTVRVVGVDPEGSVLAHFFHAGEMRQGHPYKVEGLGNDKVPGALDLGVVDDYVTVSDGDSFRMTRRLAREEGLFVGGSSGLTTEAAVLHAKALDDPDAFVVTLLCDWGERYLSKCYDDDWMRENGFLDRPRRRTVHDLVRTKGTEIPSLISVEPTTSVRVALSTLASHGVSQLPVLHEGECVGSISEERLMAGVIESPALLDRPVEAVMESPYPVVDGHIDLDEATRLAEPLERGLPREGERQAFWNRDPLRRRALAGDGSGPVRIAVVMGGTSDERDVSLASGAQVAAALRAAGHDVVAFDTARGSLSEAEEGEILDSGVRALPPNKHALDLLESGDTTMLTESPEVRDADLFFLALHGGQGEDGTLQALLEITGVPYTGSDPTGCVLAMDKDLSKRLLRDAGIPTPDWLMGPGPSAEEAAAQLGLPMIVKAARGGSSLRLRLAHDMEELTDAVEEANGYDDAVVFERYVRGRELTVAILGDEALPVGEIIPENEIFDYECKYQPGMAAEIFPADIPEALARGLRKLALLTHRTLRLDGFSRVDFIVDENGGVWCLEANNLPGMTAASLVPKAARAAGMSFPELCDRIARLALERRGSRSPAQGS